MPRADRYEKHFDMCLRAREKGLDQVADFIHELIRENAKLLETIEKLGFQENTSKEKKGVDEQN
jgi:hypothetical protein